MNERSLERALLLQDTLVVAAALVVSWFVRDLLAAQLPFLKAAVPVEQNLPLLVAFLPIWMWCADRMDLSRVRVVTGPRLDAVQAVVWTQASAVTALAVLLVAAQAPVNRSLLALHLLLSSAGLLAVVVLQGRWVREVRGEFVSLVLGAAAGEAEQELRDYRGRTVETLPDLDVEHLRRRLHAGGVAEVVLPAGARAEELRALVTACHEVGVDAILRMGRLAATGALPEPQLIGSTPYLAYPLRAPDRPALLVKAIFDRVVAAVGLVLLGPFLLLVAAAVRLTSPGPALFVQERGGLHGRPFRMLKYRTMRVGAEAERDALLGVNEMDGPVFKLRDDPRVTRVGRWLRRTSVDELPQLVNVVLGEMSLVGPRPLPLVETRALQGSQRRRLSMKPGITGLWQVSGRNDLGFEAWMALDLKYVDEWSLGRDAAILLRTFPAVLTVRGAR